jgi:hypothetical protein
VSLFHFSARPSSHSLTASYALPLSPQVASGTYNLRANRGLLRLYQMHPGRANAEVTALLLTKALMALPEPDFVQSVFLLASGGKLPQQHQTEAVKALIELDAALQKAQFRAFWEKAGSAECRALLERVPGFSDAIRSFILGALNRTCQKVETKVLAEALNVADAASFAASKGWAVEGSLVTLPPTPETSARPAKTKREEEGGLVLGMGGAAGLGTVASSSGGAGGAGAAGAPVGGTTLAGLLTTLGRTL